MKVAKLSEENQVMEKRINGILRQVKKLQDDEKPAKRKIRISKMIRQMSKLQRELDEQEELERMKKLEEEKEQEFLNRIREEVRIEQQQQKERDDKFREEMRLWLKRHPEHDVSSKHVCFLYDRDSNKSYGPKRVRKVKNYAQMAIDVFNETQPRKKYRVVDIISASSFFRQGHMVCLTFTAKANEYEGVKTFDAKIHHGIGKPTEVVSYVDFSST